LNTLRRFLEHRRQQDCIGVPDQLLQLCIGERIDLRSGAENQLMIGKALVEVTRGLCEIFGVSL
jgi:hypothetical protein